jgi:hypothetical protein
MKTVERENFVEFTRKYFALRTILKIQKSNTYYIYDIQKVFFHKN